MAGHARLSSSQTKWWANCPGALAISELNPKDDPSGYHAQMGTAAHYLIEVCLETGTSPADYSDRLLEITDPNTSDEAVKLHAKNAKWPKDPQAVVFEIDVEMVEATECMTDYVLKRLADIWPHLYEADDPTSAKKAVDNGHLKLEGYVTPLPDRDDTGGSADVTIDNWPEELEIVDYKNGSGVFVPVQGNYQLRSYSLGRAQEDDFSHERYKYTICQPRHMKAPHDGIMTEDMSCDELREFEKWLSSAATRVDEARAIVKDMSEAGSNEEEIFQALYDQGYIVINDAGHCTWCGKLNDCPAAINKVQEVAMMDFADDPEELEDATGDNHLSAILPWIPFLDKFCKTANINAENLLLSGGSIDGQKLVRKRANRKWQDSYIGDNDEPVFMDDEDRKARIVETFDLDEEKAKDLTKPPAVAALKSGPQIEKLLPKGERARFSSMFMYKPEGGLTLAPEDDPREAVDVNPGSDFDDDLD